MHHANEAMQNHVAPETATPPPLPATATWAPTSSPEDDAVLAELEKLQNPRKTWATGLVVFGISLLLFVSVGAIAWDSEFVMVLLLVLFIHELGHFAAMRFYGYRNLKMFFIPLFGAAVSGVQLRGEGWQKAVVSLMGPLPGILIGALLSLVAVQTGNPAAGSLALGFILINGFNLLPVLPLDGGQVLSSLLFSRNRYIEASFRLAACLGCGVLSVVAGSKLFIWIGMGMMLSILHSFRVSTIVQRLTEKAVPLDPGDRAGISRAAALDIIREIREVMPPRELAKPKTVAVIAMAAYERRHTVPPNTGATLGLLSVYGATAAVALLFAGLLLLHRWEVKAQSDAAFRKAYEEMYHQNVPAVRPVRNTGPQS
jgi:Zn-dependent protease